jgi:hypothetical protein
MANMVKKISAICAMAKTKKLLTNGDNTPSFLLQAATATL